MLEPPRLAITFSGRSVRAVVDTGSVGDLHVRLKQLLTAPGAKTQVALVPYVKAPTARFGIGNGGGKAAWSCR